MIPWGDTSCLSNWIKMPYSGALRLWRDSNLRPRPTVLPQWISHKQ